MKVIIASSFIIIFGLLVSPISFSETSPKTYTHTILCEEGTATWCTPCVTAGEILYSIYNSGDYPFYYIALVTDKQYKASERLNTDYNIVGFPTLFFDGGYQVKFGSPNSEIPYREAIEECLTRDVKDIDMNISVLWLDDGLINIIIEVKNNENENYNGRVRIYITEIISRWNMNNGKPYHFAFLDYAINEDIFIEPKKTYKDSIMWNGTQHGYEGITIDNILVIAAVFNSEKHLGYANPPNDNPFDAYYTDQIIAAKPLMNTPPSVDIITGPNGTIGFNTLTFEWKGRDDNTTLEELLYSYQLVLDEQGNANSWSNWSYHTNVTYENLEDGDYTFSVRAKDKEDLVTPIPAERNFRIDTRLPSIKHIFPIDGQDNVPIYTDISISFTHEMNKTSVANAIEIEPPILFQTIWGDDTITLKPIENLDYLTLYTVKALRGIRRSSGQALETNISFSFTTASEDVTPPSIVATVPMDMTNNFSTNNNITIIFSEPMDTVSVKRAIQINPWFSHLQIWKNNDTELEIIPINLEGGIYTITILNLAKDKMENNLTSVFMFSFETRTPSILYTIPDHGEKNVTTSTEISIFFSDQMNVSSLRNSIKISPSLNFTIYQNGTQIILDIPQLEHETVYQIDIGKDATTVKGTALDRDYIIYFITEKEKDQEGRVPSFYAMTTVLVFLVGFLLIKRYKKKT